MSKQYPAPPKQAPPPPPERQSEFPRMRLRTAAVDAAVEGKRVGGPWAIPLDRDALKEIKALEQEFGRVTFEREEQAHESHR